MVIWRASVAVLLVAGLSGCFVTETLDIGQPRLRSSSFELARGRTTAEELVAKLGIPFAVSQGEEEGVEVYLYVHLHKRQRTLMFPPVIPVYTLTRVKEKQRAMLVILKDRRVVEYMLLSIEDIAKKREYGFGEQDVQILMAILGR